MGVIILCIFFLAFPAAVIYASGRWPAVDKIGAGIICYGTGIALSVAGLVPEGSKPLQEAMMSVTVPLSIPLMLFSMDLRRWSRLAGKTVISLAGMITAVLAASTAAFYIFRDRIPEAWKIAGMAVGVYTGGTPNLNAIGLALQAPGHLIVLANTSDMIVCIPWFFFILSFAQRTLGTFLVPFRASETVGDNAGSAYEEVSDINDYRGIFTAPVFIPLMKAIALALLIFAAGGGLYALAPKEYNMAVLMISITTLGIVASFIPKVRAIEKTFQAGQYIILVFCLVVGSLADIHHLVTAAPSILLFMAFVVYGSWLLHLGVCKIFRIDVDTAIITSVAAIFSPPFVPVVASALRNREIILSGLTAGIIGYAAGNYLGISLAYFLRALGS